MSNRFYVRSGSFGKSLSKLIQSQVQRKTTFFRALFRSFPGSLVSVQEPAAPERAIQLVVFNKQRRRFCPGCCLPRSVRRGLLQNSEHGMTTERLP